VIDQKGYIVTNFHVVEGADEILVEFNDGNRVSGTLVGSDRETDLAVIRVEVDDLTPARLGDSRASEVGEWILAVGSPFGLDQTVTAGIISAVGRDQMGLAQYESFIQTDAAINPGNSGGPLVNLDGEVIGINTAIRSSSGGSNGIGFAIPTSIVERVSSSIIDSGRVERGWLGVAVQPLSDDLARSFGYEGEDAVLVSNVLPHTPAADAGLLAGDIITMIGEEITGDPAELIRAVGQHDAETEVEIEYVREGRKMVVVASLIERPENMEDFMRGKRNEVGQLGLIVKSLDTEEADSLGIATGSGLYVEAVEKGSPADGAGLLPGDVIRRVNGEKLQDPVDFSDAVRQSVSDEAAIRVLVERAQLTYFILIDPETG
jgi:serine protease Do